MHPTPINPFVALLMHISLCILQKLHRQVYKFRNSISILLGFCHLRATENFFFYFFFQNMKHLPEIHSKTASVLSCLLLQCCH